MFPVSASERIMALSRLISSIVEPPKKRGGIFLNGYGFNFENLAYFWLFMKTAMQGFTQKIVQMMKAEKLYEPQGGPIILSQV